MKTSRVRTVFAWILSGLLATLFLLASLGKITGNEMTAVMFDEWGYAPWFMCLVGGLEIAGAGGLLVPMLRRWAILGLGVLMLGAVYTHHVNDDGLDVIRPVIFLVILGLVWWLSRVPPDVKPAGA